jgi:tetratricopeptide (TPR) repeat protein
MNGPGETLMADGRVWLDFRAGGRPPRPRNALKTAIAVVALASVIAGQAAAGALNPSGGYWLLDVAWNQAADLPRQPARADAVELLCLLQAAVRLEPQLAEAWKQQYDLLTGLGRQEEADRALAKYVELAPDDQPAYLTYVAEQVAAAQTAEKRLAACETWLSRKDLPAPVAAFLHRTAAEILQNRLQTEMALQHAQQAVRAFPYDLAAQRLLVDLSGGKGPVVDLQIALWAVRRNPADTAAIVQVGYLADVLGLYDEADRWYAAAREIMQSLRQDTTSLALRAAQHALEAGRFEEAANQLIALTGRTRPPVEAWLLLSDAYLMMDKPQEAKQAAAQAVSIVSPATAPAAIPAAAMSGATRPASTRPIGTRPLATQPVTTRAVGTLADASRTATEPATQSAPALTAGAVATAPAAAVPVSAGPATQSAPAPSSPAAAYDRIQADWIRLIYMDETGGVLDDAKVVFDADPDQIWARRTYGWALLKSGQADRATQVLAPAAEVDAWSALGLAQARYARGDVRAAQQALLSLEGLSPAGPPWNAAQRWSRQVGLELPRPQASQMMEARSLLSQFNQTLLRLPLYPNEFLQVKLTMEQLPAAGDPWFGRIELINISDQPIFCGPDGALMPNVLITATVYDPAARDIGHRLLLSLFKPMVLAPKQSVALYRPLDTGPLRRILRNPYRKISVTLTAILDPVRNPAGTWQAGPAGMVAEPVTADRPARQLREGADLIAVTRSGSQAEKVDLARQLACMLIGVQERPPGTQPAGAAGAAAAPAMAVLLQDADPVVAAHALAQADYISLTEPLAQAAAPNVSSGNWLVRLLAIRLFAHKHGEKFTRVLGGMSASDSDPLVRQLAGTYHAEFLAGQKDRAQGARD